jgi:polyhydroxyalkanoate synthesis regulator phasin
MIQNKKTNPINDFGQVYDESNPAAFRIDQRIHNQQNRIDQGVRAGSLTREEARILRSNLKYIMEQSRGIKKDGVITNAERRRLNALLDENSNMIQDKKTNPIRQTW